MIKIDFKKAWTTHMGVLVRVLLNSEGDVVELGAGPASTPLLHWVCKDMNRRLITYESNEDYYQYARQYRSRHHKIVKVNNWDEVDTKTRRGVVFIDHAPEERRGVEALRFKDSADFVVMHDSNIEKDYAEALRHYKYVYTWKASPPWTTVASNFHDLYSLRSKEK